MHPSASSVRDLAECITSPNLILGASELRKLLSPPAPKSIVRVAEGLELEEASVEPFGWYAGKLFLASIDQLQA